MRQELSSLRATVVIPAYNTGAFLRETLDSVLAQKQPAHEIIVVDDGSTDNTGQICHSYRDSIRYIRQQNQGISVARNTGIQAATGDWITLLDSDDIFLPGHLQRTARSIRENPKAIVHYTGYYSFYPDGTRTRHAAFPAKDLWPALRYRTPILPSTSTILRSALLEINGFRKVHVEDWDLWFRLVRKHGTAGFQDVPETLLLYRRREGSFSSNHIAITNGIFELMDDLLLSGLSTPGRFLWRRRIEARTHHELAIELRSSQQTRSLHHALVSLRKWPLCGTVVPPKRYKVLANMLYKNVRNGWRVHMH